MIKAELVVCRIKPYEKMAEEKSVAPSVDKCARVCESGVKSPWGQSLGKTLTVRTWLDRS